MKEKSDSQKKSNLLKSVWITVKNCFRISPFLLVLSLIFRVIPQIVPVLVAFISGKIISELPAAVSNKNPDEVVKLLIINLILVSTSWILGTVGNYLRSKAESIIDDETQRHLFNKYQKLSLEQKENKMISDKFELARSYSQEMSYMVYFLIDIISSAAAIAFSFIALASTDFWLSIIVVSASIPIFWANSRQIIKQREYYRKNSTNRRIANRIEYTVVDPKQGMETTIFGLNNHLIKLWQEKMIDFREGLFKIQKKGMIFNTSTEIISRIVNVLVKVSIVYKIVFDSLPIGMFVTLGSLVDQLQGKTEVFLNSLNNVSENLTKATDYNDFMNLPENNLDKQKIQAEIPEIEFKNVSFKYPDSDKWILRNFNLKISAGKSIALVGENGAGKSTIVKLILGVYFPNKGQILIDGIDTKNLDFADYYERIGALMQDYNKYSFTNFGENIWFGDVSQEKDESKMKESLKLADGNKILEKMDHGFDEIMSKSFDEDNGTNLSGGEWQRLALARGFWRNPGILILDEPTAAVDARAEYEIFRQIHKHHANKTTIIISHRFSTVRQADEIIVLDSGKIVESGTHHNLMKEKGVYSEMFELQAEGYK